MAYQYQFPSKSIENQHIVFYFYHLLHLLSLTTDMNGNNGNDWNQSGIKRTYTFM